jgi:hypothetical protein
MTTLAATGSTDETVRPLGTQDAAARDGARHRIEGYDLARSLAILGMVVVHFALVMSSERMDDGGWAPALVGILDGRAAATFMVLACAGSRSDPAVPRPPEPTTPAP